VLWVLLDGWGALLKRICVAGITPCLICVLNHPKTHPIEQGIVPREPSVLFTLGRVYKRLGDLDSALGAFNGALDLAPSSADAAAIKSAIDRLHSTDDAEEEGM